MEWQRRQNQAECDDRRLFRRRSKDDWFRIIQQSTQIYLGQKYLDQENHGKWKYFFDSELQFFGGSAVFRGNLKQNDLPKYGLSDLLIMEILQIWSEVSFNSCVTSIDHCLSSSLWHNSLIKIDNRSVFYKSWYAKGVEHVSFLSRVWKTFWHQIKFSDFSRPYICIKISKTIK